MSIKKLLSSWNGGKFLFFFIVGLASVNYCYQHVTRPHEEFVQSQTRVKFNDYRTSDSTLEKKINIVVKVLGTKAFMYLPFKMKLSSEVFHISVIKKSLVYNHA